jgi:hypothetical protein
MAGRDPATQRASVCEPKKLLYVVYYRVVGEGLFAAQTRGGWVGGSRPPMEKKGKRQFNLAECSNKFP